MATRLLTILLLFTATIANGQGFQWIPLRIGSGASASFTFDPARKGNQIVLSNGNLTIGTSGGSVNSACATTTAMTSGKYYVDFTIGASFGNSIDIGIINSSATAATELNSGTRVGNTANGWAYFSGNGLSQGKRHSNSGLVYGVACTTGDVISVALDLTNGFIYIAKNNVWMNSGVPTSGATGTGAMYGSITSDTYYFVAGVHSTGTITITHTYSPPSGYTAL